MSILRRIRISWHCMPKKTYIELKDVTGNLTVVFADNFSLRKTKNGSLHTHVDSMILLDYF